MPTLNTKIWEAIASGIRALDMRSIGDPAFSTAWPIAWPGQNYEPVAGRAYLSVGETQAAPIRRIINRNINDRSGIFTVSAVMPIGTYPSAVYKQFAGRIIEHFQGCLVFDGVTLSLMSASGTTAYAPGGYRDGAYWREPMNIPWRTWA